MRPAYDGALTFLRDWIRDTNNLLLGGQTVVIYPQTYLQVRTAIQNVERGIQHEYPYFSQELEAIVNNLFVPMGNLMTINTAAFGEIFVIINQLIKEPINMRFWSDIHPDIARVSKALYCDGHFGVAAEKAMIEVETKMRSLFKECKPNTGIPKDAASLIGALLSENGCYSFCDTSERSGQNYRKGIHELFKGAFLAFRNPNVHENIECTQKEAFERITLASQMMSVLTQGRWEP